MPMFRVNEGCGTGTGIHRDRARNSDRVGVIMNRVVEVFSGHKGS